ncbi:MAG: DUF1015 domain-containing protein [Bdellovibrionales bacterium]|nr:DUF1015 domain-containing protein [Bdellovibrionales bacterium]
MRVKTTEKILAVARIRPFAPLTYNRSLIGSLGDVLSPPYDVIKSSDRLRLNNKSKWNAVNLDLTSPSDDAPSSTVSAHEESKHLLDQWIKDKILVQEKTPTIFILKDHFEFQGTSFSRIGILCTLKLEAPGSCVLPHEKVLQTPIDDRMKLIQQTQTHLSPVFFLCQDATERIQKTLSAITQNTKSEHFDSPFPGSSHTLWSITDSSKIDPIVDFFSDQRLLIADGHHRYQTSLLYSQIPENTSNEEASWCLAYISFFPSSGFVLSSFHREVSSTISTEKFVDQMPNSISVQSIPLDWNTFEKQSSSLGLISSDQQSLFTLQPKEDFDLISDELSLVPSCLLNSLLLNILGIDITKKEDQKTVLYHSDRTSLINSNNPNTLKFWLKPASIHGVYNLAKKGITLPPKSTYFFPKVPTGIAFHKIVDTA